MTECKMVKIEQCLKERSGRYKPDDNALNGLKRLEKIDFNGNIHFSAKPSKTDMIIIEPGDLVISGINVSKGALAVYQGNEPVTATIHYSSYSFDKDKIEIEYLKRFLKSPEFVQILKEQVRGGIKTEIKAKDILPLKICLPELKEQKKTVSFFQSTENEISELDNEIACQFSLLKQLRQAILQEAVEGKLTAEWRKEHPELISGDNHAARQLEKIRAKKAQLIKEGKIKIEKPLLPISDREKPYTLPEGWVFCRLGKIILNLPRNGFSPKEVNYPTNIKSLKLGATTYGCFNPNEFKYIGENIPEDSPFWLEPGDILIQRSNSIDYVGVSAIYNGANKEFIYPDLMMKIKILPPLSAIYIQKALSSPLIRFYFRNQAKGAQKSMPKINQNIVTNTLIPLPPLAEQKAIIDKVGQLMRMIDELERQAAERKDQEEMLMQSVLREAFEEGRSTNKNKT